MKILMRTGLSCIILLGAMNVAMADLMIFPAKGQSDATMEQDKFSCYGWAKGQTGFDPMKVPTTSTPSPSQQQQSGGAIRGAALGAIIGDSSKSARNAGTAGALIGGVRQRSANSKTQQNTEQWQQQESSQYTNDRSQYDRAYSACLEGKGYTVK